jgi:hypothetical protein
MAELSRNLLFACALALLGALLALICRRAIEMYPATEHPIFFALAAALAVAILAQL